MTHEWDHYDVHGLVGIRVDSGAPAAPQLRTMFACFRSEEAVPDDIVVTGTAQPLEGASHLENDLRYTDRAVEFCHDGVQVEQQILGAADGERRQQECAAALDQACHQVVQP